MLETLEVFWYNSSLTTISKTNFGTQLTLLLLRAGLVQKCFLLGRGGVGGYSRRALIRTWAVNRINMVLTINYSLRSFLPYLLKIHTNLQINFNYLIASNRYFIHVQQHSLPLTINLRCRSV